MSKTPQRGLGRGLDALFHNAASEEVRTVPLGKITPNRFQPRKHFDEDALAELSELCVNTAFYSLLWCGGR